MAVVEDPGAAIALGDFLIDRRDERVIGPAGPLRLGRKAYRMLVELALLGGKLLTKDALLSSVWDGTIVSEAALTSVVKELRRALGDDPRAPRYIETVYGRGYRLLAPVGPAPDRPTPVPQPRSPSRASNGERAARLGRPPALFVPAFDARGFGGDQAHLADQLHDEVVAGLARFRELRLVADAGPGPDGAARFDGRAYRLDALIAPRQDGLRVIARLQRLHDGVVVWTEAMPVAAGAMAAGIDAIVRRIVGAALPVVDEDMLAEMPADADSVYDAYLAAKWQSFHARSFAEARAAADALERIVADHPGFALAYPPLVRLYNTDFGYTALGLTGPAERARALALAKEGLAADRGNAHAHSVLAFCHFWQGDLALARACFDRSLQLNPFNHVRLQEAATAFMKMGEIAEARALLDRAAELNPFPDDDYHEDMGRLLLLEGDYEGAHRSLRALSSGSIWAGLYLAACEIRLGLREGPGRLAAWRDRVAAHWHSGAAPGAERIAAWIRFHHPFPGSTGGNLLSVVDASSLASASM